MKEMIELLLSILVLIADIMIFINMLGMRKLLKDANRYDVREENAKNENTHQEIPEWVETFIDEYMANSETDNHQ